MRWQATTIMHAAAEKAAAATGTVEAAVAFGGEELREKKRWNYLMNKRSSDDKCVHAASVIRILCTNFVQGLPR